MILKNHLQEQIWYPGQFKLYEESAPTGYETASDITFWVDGEEGVTRADQVEVQNDTIIMTDKKANYNYTIEYYYDNVKDASKTETGSAVYQSIIDSYPDKNITGYKLDKAEPRDGLVIGTEPENNVMKVYYVKDNFDYTIEYYYDGIRDDTKTETNSAEYQSTINTYPDKNITGYKLDSTEGFLLTITENSANNLIKVYYVKDSFRYSIEYYYV